MVNLPCKPHTVTGVTYKTYTLHMGQHEYSGSVEAAYYAIIQILEVCL